MFCTHGMLHLNYTLQARAAWKASGARDIETAAAWLFEGNNSSDAVVDSVLHVPDAAAPAGQARIAVLGC